MFSLIKQHIGLKIFLLLVVTLSITGTFIYVGVLVYTPKTIRNQVTNEFEQEFEQLFQQIKKEGIENCKTLIQEFCDTNQIIVRFLSNKNGTMDIIYEDGSRYRKKVNKNNTISIITKTMEQKNKEVILVMTYASTEAVNEIEKSLQYLFPYVIFFSFVISLITASICSLYISKPIIEISKNSNKMASLDLKVNWDKLIKRG